MEKEKEIPISEAKALSKKYGYDQVIILAQNYDSKKKWFSGWRTTYNKDKTKCKFLGKVANILAYNFRAFYSNKKITGEYNERVIKAITKETLSNILKTKAGADGE